MSQGDTKTVEITARYRSACTSCGHDISIGQLALYRPAGKRVAHRHCGFTDDRPPLVDADRRVTMFAWSPEHGKFEPELDEYVYVISCDVYCKVGRSGDPFGRMRDLQSSNPFPLAMRWIFWAEDAVALEGDAHKALESYRIRGEWFECSPRRVAQTIFELSGETAWRDPRG